MRREYFGSWGAELDGPTFARALAQLGVHSSETTPKVHTLRWRWWRVDRSLPRADPVELANAWARDRAADQRVRLAIEGAPWRLDLDAPWLAETLKSATAVSAVHFDFGPRHVREWHWPLEIAVLDGPGDRALLTSVKDQHFRQFVRFGLASEAGGPIDLLLVPGSLPDALRTVMTSGRLPPVHTVIAIGDEGKLVDPLGALWLLRTEAKAAGAVTCSVTEANQWMGRLILELAHDYTLDESLFAATMAFSRTQPLIIGGLRELKMAQASKVMGRVGRDVARLEGTVDGFVPDLIREGLGFDDGHSLQDAGRAIDADADLLDWRNEGKSATALLDLQAAASARGVETPMDARFVQARIKEVQDGAHVSVADRPLHSSTLHRIQIRIGSEDEEWATSPQRFPQELLTSDSDEHGHELTIVFIAPSVLERPASATLLLPPSGNSPVCDFYFKTFDGVGELDARVIVLHENRLIQSLRIRAGVGVADPGHPLYALSIAPEVSLSEGLSGLSTYRGFDASILFNDSASGDGVAVFDGENVAYLSLGAMEDTIKEIRIQLEKVTKAPEKYASMDDDATRAILVTLARMGYELRTSLEELPGMDGVLAHVKDASGKNRRRLQVLSFHPDEVVPLEYCYTRDIPVENATLCKNWRPALETGSCGSDCSSTENEHVCPLGFIGLRHVIERHLWEKADVALLNAKHAKLMIAASDGGKRKTLTSVGNVLLGLSDKAASHDLATFNQAVADIGKLATTHAATLRTVNGWPAWSKDIEQAPEILILLGHTENRMGAFAMQLGTEKCPFLAAGEVRSGHVREPPPTTGVIGPIVLLFGCRTTDGEVPNSTFVAAFRRHRASVIVGTMGTVRGRHMAPAAKAALQLVLEGAKGTRRTFGDVLLEMRREMLRLDHAVGLTFIAFGDVDLQLGGGS